MTIFRDDPDLLSRYRAGDRKALEAIYWAYIDKVEAIFRFGFQSRCAATHVYGASLPRDQIEDMVQDVFTKAFAPRARASFDGSRAFGPYLGTIARHTLVDRHRRHRREKLVDPGALAAIVDRACVPVDEEMCSSPSLLGAVKRHVAGLSDELRLVHEARFDLGLSQRDAAARLGWGRQVLRTREARLLEGVNRAVAHCLAFAKWPAVLAPREVEVAR